MAWEHYKLNKGEKIKLCSRCLTLSTRPRVIYDENGVCNACTWADTKKTYVDWNERWNELKKICDKYRRSDGLWDVIVPCSGGKDGSHVAWTLKNVLNMHPLCITLSPHLPTEIGKTNLKNFLESGFDHIFITPNLQVYRKFAKRGFIEQGRPKVPFNVGVSTAVIRIAIRFGVPFIMWGEEGEEEYGGATTQVGKYIIDKNYLIKYYYSGHNPNEYLDEFTKEELKWWLLPSNKEIKKADLYPTHWSHFENWDPKLHFETAKKHCNIQTLPDRSIGTFTNNCQLDDKIQDLHAYMMYIKFGFGRAWSDACIEIRAGRMTREEGIEMVKKYDGEFPYKYLRDYLNYYNMTTDEFWNVVDSYRSPDIWKQEDGEWKLKFDIK